MATDVVMPQMGESIAEGTVVRWIKKPGDKVERDEPLLEISTDKVDAEIPAPASGTLTEIVVQEGQTVAVNAVVARIATDGGRDVEPPVVVDAMECRRGQLCQSIDRFLHGRRSVYPARSAGSSEPPAGRQLQRGGSTDPALARRIN